jgi:hypothetical protein
MQHSFSTRPARCAFPKGRCSNSAAWAVWVIRCRPKQSQCRPLSVASPIGRQTRAWLDCPLCANHVMACVVLNERGTMVARRITTSSGSPISQIGMRIAVHAAWGGVINWGKAMPTDMLAAMVRKAELRKQQQDECCVILLIPLIVCISTLIMAVESPSFAAAVIISGLY